MGKIELYYSSEISEPWCDLGEIRDLLGKLEEKGVSVSEIDTAEVPEAEIKEFYTSSAVFPSIKSGYKVSSLFGTRRDAGCFFGREQPGLVVYREGADLPVDVYPHDEKGRRVTIADYLSERLAGLEEES